MERSSFLKGLFTGAIGLATIPAYSKIEEKPSVKKLTDAQLLELYESYVSSKREKEESLRIFKEIDLFEVGKQNQAIPSISFLNKVFSYKRISNVDTLYVKKHIKNLQAYKSWIVNYKDNNGDAKTFSYMKPYDMDYVKFGDIHLSMIKGHILLGEIAKAEELYPIYIKERSGGYVTFDTYGIIYFADLLFSKGYYKEALTYYQQSDKNNIKKWVQKLEDGNDINFLKEEFNKRYYHKAYFGNMYSDLAKKKLAKPLHESIYKKLYN